MNFQIWIQLALDCIDWIFFWNIKKSDEPKKVGLWKNEKRRLDNLNRDTKKIIRWADARNRLRINGNQKILEEFEKRIYCKLPVDVRIRPPQEVDVLAVLDFYIPCFRPEAPALHPRSLLTNHEGDGRKLGRPRGFQWSRTARTSTSGGALVRIQIVFTELFRAWTHRWWTRRHWWLSQARVSTEPTSIS